MEIKNILNIFNYFSKNINKKKNLLLNLCLIFICFLIIFFSNLHFSYLDYFWFDFRFAQYAHNMNLKKQFLDILPNSGSIFGITLWILNPWLNILSSFNYNLSNKSEYFMYLTMLRFLEVLTLITFLYSFSKKLEIKNLSIIFFYMSFY